MNKTISRTFGPVLKLFRTERKLTQEELAEKVGVVTSYISMLENGQKFPNLEMLFALADALNIKTSTLIQAMEQRIA